MRHHEFFLCVLGVCFAEVFLLLFPLIFIRGEHRNIKKSYGPEDFFSLFIEVFLGFRFCFLSLLFLLALFPPHPAIHGGEQTRNVLSTKKPP
jgi:hypothetical protein